MRWNKRTGDVDKNGQPKGKQKCQLSTIQIGELSDDGCRKYDAFDQSELVISDRLFQKCGSGNWEWCRSGSEGDTGSWILWDYSRICGINPAPAKIRKNPAAVRAGSHSRRSLKRILASCVQMRPHCQCSSCFLKFNCFNFMPTFDHTNRRAE